MNNPAAIQHLAAIKTALAAPPSPAPQATLPRPDHVVIVFEENKGYGDIVGSPYAPYLNSLIAQGASLTNFHALHHPSQPNYIEFFSGADQGVFNDTCPPSSNLYTVPSLGGSIKNKHLTFVGYADSLPPNPKTCNPNLNYARKHCPWVDFKDSTKMSKNFLRFAADMANNKLPTVALVIPDLAHDMHNPNPPMGCNLTPTAQLQQEICNGDTWLKGNLDAYVQWAKTHNSLLIVTWDENSDTYNYPEQSQQKIDTQPPANQIATIFVGPMVKVGATSATVYTHHDLLRTIEEMYGLPLLGGSQNAKVITGIWQ